jgi:ABC-type antimicrobial peptide transport system permease subunit
MFIGILILALFSNVVYFVNERYENLLNTDKDKEFVFNTYITPDVKDPPFTLSQIEHLKSTYTNAKINPVINYNIINFAGKTHKNELGEEVLDNYILCYTGKAEKITASSEFVRTISAADKDNTVNFDSLNFSAKENSVFWKGSEDVDNITIDEKCDIGNTHIMYVPVECFFKYNSESFTDVSIEVTADGDIGNINDTVMGIRSYISENNSNYQYELGNDFFGFMKKAYDAKEKSALFSAVAVALIVIVYIGMVSVFLLILEKRNFLIAITLTSGASTRQVITELVAEFSLLAFLPTLLAVITSHIIMLGGFTFVFVTIPSANPVISIFIILFNMCFIFLSLLPVIFKVKKLKPYELLREY